MVEDDGESQFADLVHVQDWAHTPVPNHNMSKILSYYHFESTVIISEWAITKILVCKHHHPGIHSGRFYTF